MRLFRKDFLRGVTGWMFYLAVLLGLVCCLRSMFYVMFSFELVPVGTLNLFFGTVVFNEGGYLLIVAPLIAALPFSMAYLDDVRSGFLKCEILRMRPASYAFQRALSTAVLGGLVFVVIMGIYLLICLFVDPRASLRGAAPYDFVFKSTYAHTMKGALGLYLLQCFEYGACYALFAMGLSALIPVKIIAFLRHFREHKIGCAVDDAVNIGYYIGRQGFIQRCNNRHSAAHAGFKQKANAFFLGKREQFRTVHSHQLFIGSSDMLAAFQRRFYIKIGRV